MKRVTDEISRRSLQMMDEAMDAIKKGIRGREAAVDYEGSKVAEIYYCSECPHYNPHPNPRHGGGYCHHEDSEKNAHVDGDDRPDWCPLLNTDDMVPKENILSLSEMAALLKIAREDAGISQMDLAYAIADAQSNISLAENHNPERPMVPLKVKALKFLGFEVTGPFYHIVIDEDTGDA